MATPMHRRMAHGAPRSRPLGLLAATLALCACSGRASGTGGDDAAGTPRNDDAWSSADAPPAPPSPAAATDVAPDAATEAAVVPNVPALVVRAEGGLVHVRAPDGSETTLDLAWRRTIADEASARDLREWVRDGDAWKATAEDGTTRWTVTLAVEPARPALMLRVIVEYLAPLEVRHEELTLSLPGARDARVLGRDMLEHALPDANGSVTDAWTPLEVRATSPIGPLTITRTAGFASAVTEADENGLTVHLELDDAENHPYRPYVRCFSRYSAKNPRDDLDGTPRNAGERAEHVAEIVIGDFLPLRLQRLPAGRRAAIVFTSHADQSTTATTQALLWGASSAADPTYGTRGMVGHGLAMTLAAFAESGTHADMSDAAFLAVLEDAAAAGMEVCPHSVTAGLDDRETVARLLPSFARFEPSTWIDHQPDTNCEAVMNSGGIAGRDARYFDIDLLHGAGLRYVWSEPDVEPPGGGLNMLGAQQPAYRPAILFRNGNVRDGAWVPWMFRTVWMFVEMSRFVERFNEGSMQRLIDENGIHLAHVYMDTYQARGRLANRSLLERDGDGFRIREDVDEVFRRLGDLQRDGSLWIPTMRALGDHLAAISELRINYAADGSVVVIGGSLDVDDVTFAVPTVGATITVDGNRPDGIVEREGQTVFWFDLPSGTSRTIRMFRDGLEGRFSPVGSTVVEP